MLFRASNFVLRIFKYVSCISSSTGNYREPRGGIRPAVGDHTLHGTAGIPVSRVGGSFHRTADGFSLDTRTFPPISHIHCRGARPSVGS